MSERLLIGTVPFNRATRPVFCEWDISHEKQFVWTLLFQLIPCLLFRPCVIAWEQWAWTARNLRFCSAAVRVALRWESGTLSFTFLSARADSPRTGVMLIAICRYYLEDKHATVISLSPSFPWVAHQLHFRVSCKASLAAG